MSSQIELEKLSLTNPQTNWRHQRGHARVGAESLAIVWLANTISGTRSSMLLEAGTKAGLPKSTRLRSQLTLARIVLPMELEW